MLTGSSAASRNAARPSTSRQVHCRRRAEIRTLTLAPVDSLVGEQVVDVV